MRRWQRGTGARGADEGAESAGQPAQEASGEAAPSEDDPAPEPDVEATPGKTENKASKSPKKAGRRKGALGHGRRQKLEPTRREEHRPRHCGACARPLSEHGPAQAWTGWDTLELMPLGAEDEGVPGVRIEVTRHLLMKQRCACGHTNRAVAAQAGEDALWPGVRCGCGWCAAQPHGAVHDRCAHQGDVRQRPEPGLPGRAYQRHRDARHQALREVAREFLNDWQAIMRVLDRPELPLTNNLAERMLRHHVIARRISYGTRTRVGSESMGLLSSIIDTCRLRGVRATDLLARAIHAARCGMPAPALPDIPAHCTAHSIAMRA